ncbi:MAG: ROK family protein, partial [Rhizobiaceae bacterium]
MAYAIALDLGGTQTRAALVDAEGNLTNRITLPTPAQDGGEAVVAQLAKAANHAAQGARDIIGIGLSSPGPLDTETGRTIHLPTINGMTNFPIRDALAEKLGRKVLLENDGISAAIGEWKFGGGRGLHSMVFVTLSTGIGGGVVVNDTVVRGHMGMASHVGHMAVERDGLRCGCGNTGCWEAYAAGPAFAARASAALGQQLQPTDVFALAREGNATAQTQVDEQAKLLGIGLTSLLYLFSPQRIIVGGGLTNAWDQLEPGIAAYIKS